MISNEPKNRKFIQTLITHHPVINHDLIKIENLRTMREDGLISYDYDSIRLTFIIHTPKKFLQGLLQTDKEDNLKTAH